jgi:hypothetical protein
MSMNRYDADADDQGQYLADTTSARWAGYKVVGGGNEYDVLEREGVAALNRAGSSPVIPNTCVTPFVPDATNV